MPMKSVCRWFIVGVIALVALMGVLLIAQGMRQPKVTWPPALFEMMEGVSTL